jgi:hypothetical protein
LASVELVEEVDVDDVDDVEEDGVDVDVVEDVDVEEDDVEVDEEEEVVVVGVVTGVVVGFSGGFVVVGVVTGVVVGFSGGFVVVGLVVVPGGEKVARTKRSRVRRTVHEPLPEQAAAQPSNVQPLSGVAVRVTIDPAL